MESGQYILRALERQRDLYLRPEDRILFVLDWQGRILDEPFYRWKDQMDVCFIPKVTHPGMEYSVDSTLLEGKTVAWLITDQSITHSSQTRKMKEQGIFIISNPNIGADWPAMLTKKNRSACEKNAKKIIDAIGCDVAAEVRITCEDGTNLTLFVPARNWKVEAGYRTGRGTNGMFGELTNVPYHAEGTIFINQDDFITNPINRIVQAERGIEIDIVDNQAVAIGTEGEGEELFRLLEATGNPLAFGLGEVSLGINPGRPKELLCSTVAEKLLGGVHIALGTPMGVRPDVPEIGLFKHGTGYSAGIHLDLIKFGATVTVNDVLVLDRGHFIL